MANPYLLHSNKWLYEKALEYKAFELTKVHSEQNKLFKKPKIIQMLIVQAIIQVKNQAYCDRKEYNLADGIHPNAKGHQLIANTIAKFIAENL